MLFGEIPRGMFIRQCCVCVSKGNRYIDLDITMDKEIRWKDQKQIKFESEFFVWHNKEKVKTANFLLNEVCVLVAYTLTHLYFDA